jgi:glucose/arabinose dehydrogenase
MKLLALILVAAILPYLAFADEPVPKISLQPVVSGLDKPLYLTHHNTPEMYIVEQTGKVRVLEKGHLREKPFLDLTSKVNIDYECGLLSIAFHPDYAHNGYVYAYYTATFPALKSVLAEYKVDVDGQRIDLSTERILLHFSLPYNTHHAGQLNFGPDGMLYIAVGDGGFGNDPFNNGQTGTTYLGKILRIDVSRRDPYGIPKDNPFLADNTFFPEIYAYGLRNPWRFSFDRGTGLLYCADVGQDRWEKINVIEKGGNYGWRIMEGPEFLHPVPKPPKMNAAIFQYHHENAPASVTGGYVYRGKANPGLVGWYIFGDYVDGRIFALKYAGGILAGHGVAFRPPTDGTLRKDIVRPNNLQPASFGEDADGEVYVCDITNGRVFKIAEDTSR